MFIDIFAWYPSSATRWIFIYGFEHGLGIYTLKVTWTCLINVFLAWWANFFKPSGYFAVINCTIITFPLISVFAHFYIVMTPSDLIRYVSNIDHITRSSVGFQITHRLRIGTIFQCTNYHDTTNLNGYLPLLEMFRSRDMRPINSHVQKYWKTFDSNE